MCLAADDLQSYFPAAIASRRLFKSYPELDIFAL